VAAPLLDVVEAVVELSDEAVEAEVEEDGAEDSELLPQPVREKLKATPQAAKPKMVAGADGARNVFIANAPLEIRRVVWRLKANAKSTLISGHTLIFVGCGPRMHRRGSEAYQARGCLPSHCLPFGPKAVGSYMIQTLILQARATTELILTEPSFQIVSKR